ncbi:MAG: hypothetical protein H0T47_06585 [Planctomycetaceae bacterium]|nr:hypothetical protein [Planctomycetaceae bacterium]
MFPERPQPRIAQSGEIIAPPLIGLTVVLILLAAPDAFFRLALAAAAGTAVGLLVWIAFRLRRIALALSELRVPMALAATPEFFHHYDRLGSALVAAADRADPLFRNLAAGRLERIASEVETLADGTVVFHSTETWRDAYEALLRSPGLTNYFSVAWVRSPDYWRDEPARRSLELNYELHDAGRLNVERIVVIADDLWPADERLPDDDVLAWIDEQHRHAIWVRLVRASALSGEPDLPADFGIYGARAVGVQELDERARTSRFLLAFDLAQVEAAEDRWRRLCVYATPYRKLLDQLDSDA